MAPGVVIFDDNRNILDSIALLLQTAEEFSLLGSFTHARDCVEAVRQTDPSIVLMDIEMPDVNGIEATVM